MEKLSRPLWSHKGDFGTVLVVGGSELYTGSPIFNGLAALRAGADLAILVGHPRAMNAAATYSPDLITQPLKGDPAVADIPAILKLAERCDAAVIGGGLARTPAVHDFILKLISKLEIPMVLDAEALHAIAKEPGVLKGKKVILTPHAEEFHVLTGEHVQDEVKDRERKVKLQAAKLGATILLKGHADLISDGGQNVLNTTGSAYMTKGGTGDVLAGICASLLAQGYSTMEAARKATWMNGKAGERLADKRKDSFLTSDLLEELNLA